MSAPTTLGTMTDAFDPSALFGGGDNQMADLLAQAQAMQNQLYQAQQEIAAAKLIGSAGNGLVTIEGNGTGDITAVTIAKDVVDPEDVDTLQDLILGALADLALCRAALTEEKLGPLSAGMPGLG